LVTGSDLADRFQKADAGGRPEEVQMWFEALVHKVWLRWHLFQPTSKRSGLQLDHLKCAGVVDRGFDFTPMTDDAGILHQFVDFVLGVMCNDRDRAARESSAKPLPAMENRSPGEARLKRLQCERFEVAVV